MNVANELREHKKVCETRIVSALNDFIELTSLNPKRIEIDFQTIADVEVGTMNVTTRISTVHVIAET